MMRSYFSLFFDGWRGWCLPCKIIYGLAVFVVNTFFAFLAFLFLGSIFIAPFL